MAKNIIYQMLPRLWGNDNEKPVKGGSLEENGTGKFSNMDNQTLEYLKWLGVTHVWYTGIRRHATKSNSQGCTPSHPQFVKGEVGSPYSITDYRDVNPYLADDPEHRMEEFEDLVRRTHEAGLKVIIDFVPNHVSRDYRGSDLGKDDDKSVHWKPKNDFFYYPGQSLNLPNSQAYRDECTAFKNVDFNREYKLLPKWLVNEGFKCRHKQSAFEQLLESNAAILKCYEESPAKATGNDYTPDPAITDWYDTVKINYCDFHTSTWDKMYEIVRFWAKKGVDGFRCDMVELVPMDFFKWLISKIKYEFKDLIFIAEVYQKQNYAKYIYQVGFDMLYDKSGLYDSLRAIVGKNLNDSGVPVELWQSAKTITWNWPFLGGMQPKMLNFLENHDEQRFASDAFGKDPKNTFAAMYVSLFLNTSAFMIYCGEEVGESGMDFEGLSGINGRTSIFDWWSIKSLRGLYRMVHCKEHYINSLGKASRKTGLSESQLRFFGRFASVIQKAAYKDVISKGSVYDLCYFNYSADGFDENKHFVFLRHYGNDTILVFSNFSKAPAKAKIRIPKGAFEYMHLPETSTFNADTAIEVDVQPMDAVIINLI